MVDDRATDDTARVADDDHREVEPALPGTQIADVGDPRAGSASAPASSAADWGLVPELWLNHLTRPRDPLTIELSSEEAVVT